MSKKISGLGRGLDSILLDNSAEPSSSVVTVRTSLIEPRKGQPRKRFEEDALVSLAESIALHGILQPIIVREADGGRYQIIAGERRWRAAKMAELTEVPVMIISPDEAGAAQISLVENIQRENLSPVEEAKAYRSLVDGFGLTQEDISRSTGKNRSTIANALRLLELPDKALEMVDAGHLSAGHARALLALADEEQIIPLAERAADGGMSVRELEAAVKKANTAPKEIIPPPLVDYSKELECFAMENTGHRVKIAGSGKNKHIKIFYEDNEDLEAIVTVLTGGKKPL